MPDFSERTGSIIIFLAFGLFLAISGYDRGSGLHINQDGTGYYIENTNWGCSSTRHEAKRVNDQWMVRDTDGEWREYQEPEPSGDSR